MRRLFLTSGTALLAFLLLAPPAAAEWVWPLHGEVITPYRNGSDPYASGQHRGIDIAGPTGAAVVAATGGEVQFAGAAGSSGLTVSLRTADGRYDTSYLHLSSTAVREGEHVAAGQRLGTVGTTGTRSASEPHLHFGVRDAGSRHAYHDPLAFLPHPGATPSPRGAPAPQPAPLPVAPAPAPLPVHAPAGGRVPVRAPARRPVPVPRRVPAGAPRRVPTADPQRVPARAPRRVPAGDPQRVPAGAPRRVPAGEPRRVPAGGPRRIPAEAPRRVPTGEPRSVPAGDPGQVPVGDAGRVLAGEPGRVSAADFQSVTGAAPSHHGPAGASGDIPERAPHGGSASESARFTAGGGSPSGPDLGLLAACLGLLAAAAVLGLTQDGRRATRRTRHRVARVLQPMFGRR